MELPKVCQNLPCLNAQLGMWLWAVENLPQRQFVQASLPFASPSPERVELSTAVRQFLSEQEFIKARPAYVRSLRQYLAQFIKRFGYNFPVSEFSQEAVEQWFYERGEAATTMKSNLGRLSSFFSYCLRKKYILEHPCKEIQCPRIVYKPPFILSVRQCAVALEFTRTFAPDFLACLALALFAGVRPDELDKLRVDAIYLDRQILRIDADVAKTWRMRLSELHPTCLAWLKVGLPHCGTMVSRNRTARKRWIIELRGALGFQTWPQDCLRHTAASYSFAIDRSAARVAEIMGNSPDILLRHYRALVWPESANAFWELTP